MLATEDSWPVLKAFMDLSFREGCQWPEVSRCIAPSKLLESRAYWRKLGGN
jgi:hypothetical protein